MRTEELQRIAAESTRWMAAGLEAMARGGFAEALGFFERAVELRERLPWREDGESAWMLAAAWLNRGDMLGRLGGDFRGGAVAAFDRAIEAMGFVPLAEKPAFVERLVLAWINRGTVCGELGEFAEALAGFAEAETLLETWGAGSTVERLFQSAMLRVNRARVLMDAGRPLEAWDDARRAVEIFRGLEKLVPVGGAGITARSVQCRALALLLDEPGGAEEVGDWIAEATDSAEEALALVKASGFRDGWVGDLVRYGAKIYRLCQPQFLGEFLAEWLGKDGPLAGDEILKREMRNELLLARAEVERKVLLLPQDTEFVAKQIRILKALQAGEAKFQGVTFPTTGGGDCDRRR